MLRLLAVFAAAALVFAAAAVASTERDDSEHHHSPPARNAHDEIHILDHIRHRSIRRPTAHELEASGVAMSVSPSVLPTSGEWVTLKWSGVDKPKADDWIAVYSPSNADVKLTKPVKYVFCSKASGYLSSGAGEWAFRLLNVRSDYKFVLYRNGLTRPVYAGASNTVSFTNINEPLGAHLSVGTDTSSMLVSWNSGVSGAARVRWGTSSGSYQWTVDATATTYTAADLCGPPANAEGWLPQGPGFFQTAVMSGLNPSTPYYYVFGDDTAGAGGWSHERRFVSSPAVGADASFNFFAFGDLGQDQLDGTLNWSDGPDFQPSRNTTLGMLQQYDASDDGTYGLVLHIGDVAYARGYASEWPNFFDQIEPLADALPWLVTDGNHERDFPGSGSLWNGTDSGGECGVPYAHRFTMPIVDPELQTLRPLRRRSSRSRGSMTGVVHDTPWWSYNFGSIHFVIMSTEHAFDADSEQYAFLRDDILSVNRSLTPWIIFAGHRPMYIDSTNTDPPAGDQPVASALRESIEPLLRLNGGVDLALWGHHHSYQRTCPVFNETCVPTGTKGTVHLVIGMAGAGLSQNIELIPPPWIDVVNCDFYGYITIEVNGVHDSMTIRSIQSIDSQQMDEFTLIR